MTTLRPFRCEDMFKFNNVNLDVLTETVSTASLTKSLRWSTTACEMFSTCLRVVVALAVQHPLLHAVPGHLACLLRDPGVPLRKNHGIQLSDLIGVARCSRLAQRCDVCVRVVGGADSPRQG